MDTPRRNCWRYWGKMNKSQPTKNDSSIKEIYPFSPDIALQRPLFLSGVSAGFPSPAEEELIDTLSLDEYLVDKPEASFLLKVTGDSMIEAGIHEGDLVIIERGGQARSGDIVLACVDGEWTLKYYHKASGGVELVPANPKYPVIRPEKELTLGGIVRAVMRRY